jgi:hypothetical protein
MGAVTPCLVVGIKEDNKIHVPDVHVVTYKCSVYYYKTFVK